jgi:AraC-like DNA-binding protein
MEVILNAGLGIGMLMFMLLLFKQGKSRQDYFFLFWLLVTLLQIVFYDMTIYRFELYGFWAITSFGLPLLGAPLLFLYILSLTGHGVSRLTLTIHLGFYFAFVGILLFLQEHDNVVLVASEGYIQIPETPPGWMYYYAIPLAISGLLYCVWNLSLLRRHRKTIADLFSFEEKISLSWVRYVVYSYFILFVLTSFLIFGATQFQLFPKREAFALVGIVLSIMLVAFGFYGFRQTAIFSNISFEGNKIASLPKNEIQPASYAKSGLDTEKIKSLANLVATHMEKEKPFLNEDLSLAMLAEHCKISQGQLSQVINQQFQINFYDFVNRYRVEEAKKKLVSSNFDHLSILGIAFECGFKSKSSFNRYFKKYTGIAPTEFKKR